MKERCYKVQLVGNVDTVKRMVASLYLVDSKKKEQVLKVCVCDDLPHVINSVDAQQRHDPSHELLETGLTLQVAHGRSLTIRANIQEDNGLCVMDPEEVVIPPEAIWESNAAFATDFILQMRRPHEDASIQVSITSKDDLDSDIPLSVPPRVHVSWHPKEVVGVQRIRKAWEMSDVASTLPRVQPQTSRKSSTLPRYQQPVYQKIEKILQDRPRELEVSPRGENYFSSRSQGTKSFSQRNAYASKPLPVQDKNWNVVSSPQSHNEDDDLPTWAKGLGDQYDYDDVVVV